MLWRVSWALAQISCSSTHYANEDFQTAAISPRQLNKPARSIAYGLLIVSLWVNRSLLCVHYYTPWVRKHVTRLLSTSSLSIDQPSIYFSQHTLRKICDKMSLNIPLHFKRVASLTSWNINIQKLHPLKHSDNKLYKPAWAKENVIMALCQQAHLQIRNAIP